MARAIAFDQWEDPGMGFSKEELDNFSWYEIVERRLDVLIDVQNTLYALAQIPGGNIETPRQMAKQAKSMATGLVKFSTLHMEAPAQSDFNTLDKEFMVAAHGIYDLRNWTEEFKTDTESWLRHYVSLARRCKYSSKFDPEIKVGNKVVNQVVNQRKTSEYWLRELIATPRKREDEED